MARFAEAVESVAETSRSTLSEDVRWRDSASRLSARLETSVVELARTRARIGRIKPSRARVLLRLPLPKPNRASLFPQRGKRRRTFRLTLAMTDSHNVSLLARPRVFGCISSLLDDVPCSAESALFHDLIDVAGRESKLRRPVLIQSKASRVMQASQLPSP